MSGLLKGSLSEALVVAIALAWPWTNLLKDAGYLNDIGRAAILIALTVVLTCQQVYVAMPRPVGSGIMNSRRSPVDLVLGALWDGYYAALVELGVSEPRPLVRINVMVVTKRWKGLLGTYLRIYYHHPTGVLYSSEELELKWGKSNGVVGRAWNNKYNIAYDSELAHLEVSGKGMTEAQKAATSNRKSALRVPIVYGDDFVGMLNMDSMENVSRTKFDETKVVSLAVEAASFLAGQLDPKGVAD